MVNALHTVMTLDKHTYLDIQQNNAVRNQYGNLVRTGYTSGQTPYIAITKTPSKRSNLFDKFVGQTSCFL